MNINQAGSGGFSKQPRVGHNPASSPIKQPQEQAVDVDDDVNDQEMKLLMLVGIIQSNKIFTPSQLHGLVHHDNIKIIRQLMKHRGHELKPHHIDVLIARNNSEIDALFIKKPLPQMSEHQSKQIFNRIFLPL